MSRYNLRPSTRRSQSARAGVIFPVARLANKLRSSLLGKRVTKVGGVYLTSIIEYLAAEILELSGNACKDLKKKRITPRHINLAILADSELDQLLKHVVIPGGGVYPLRPEAVTSLPVSAKNSVSKKIVPAPTSTAIAQTPLAKTLKEKVTTLNRRTLNKGQTLIVLQADIVDVEVDAVVAHFYLSGLVGAAISKKGGFEMQNIINDHRASTKTYLSTCEADITDASKNLLCKKIIHINSPSWDASQQTLKINELTRTVENILSLAEAHKLKSVALPNISSAGNMFPKQVAAQTILRAVRAHFKVLEDNPLLPKSSLTEVYFVLFDPESVNVYISELGKLDIS